MNLSGLVSPMRSVILIFPLQKGFLAILFGFVWMLCPMNIFILANCNCQNIGTQKVDCDERCLNRATDPFRGQGRIS